MNYDAENCKLQQGVPKMAKDFSNRLRAERERLGFGQAEFADKLKLARRTYASWESESGTANPNLDDLLRMTALGIDTPWILSGCKERTKPDVLAVHIHAAQFQLRENLGPELLALLAESWVQQGQQNEAVYKEETDLLTLWRSAPDSAKTAAMAVLRSLK